MIHPTNCPVHRAVRRFGSACRPSTARVGDPSRHAKRRAAGKQNPYSHRVARHNPLRAIRRLPQFRNDSSCGVVEPVSRTNGRPCHVEHRLTRGILSRFRRANRICCLVQFFELDRNTCNPLEVFPTYPDLSFHPDLHWQSALFSRSVLFASVCLEQKSLFVWPAGFYGDLRIRFDSKFPNDLANRTKPHLDPCRSLPFRRRAKALCPADPTRAFRPTHSADGRTPIVLRSGASSRGACSAIAS